MTERPAFPGRGMAACLLAALLLAGCGGGSDEPAEPASAPQTLQVTARDFALDITGPRDLRPGPVTIRARNTGKERHGMILVRLNEGIDTRELVSALRTKPGSLGEMLVYVGGTTTLPPESTWEATTSFEPGSYAMVDVGAAKGGRLNFTRDGEVQGFSVAGDPRPAATARASAEVALFDYGITMPRVIPATGRITVRNTGNDDHQLSFVRVKDAAEARRMLTSIKAGKGASITHRPIEVVAPSTGATATTVRYALPKGAYLAYCTYATAASGGRRHSALGMVTAFGVG